MRSFIIAAGLTLLVSLGVFADGQSQPIPDPRITHTVSVFSQADLKRSSESDLYLRVRYDITAFDFLHAAIGVSLSFTPFAIDGYFLSLGIDNIAGTGLGAFVKFMGDQYPEYGRAANTITPFLVWRWAIFDLAFGITWRFLVIQPDQIWNMFYYDPLMVEPIFYYRIGVVFSFFDNRWRVSLSLSNQDDFYAGTFGAFTLELGNRVAVNEHWSVQADFLIRPAGTIALTAVNSIFILRLGGRLAL